MRKTLIFLIIYILFWGGVALFYPANPYTINLNHVFMPPAWGMPLGADELGRDILVRLSYGVLISLSIGFVVLCIGFCIGVSLGIVAGWYGKAIGAVIMRVADIFLSFPGILLALALAALMGGGYISIIVALSLGAWVGFARLAYQETLALKHKEFLQAAELSGVARVRQLGVYILPNISAPLLVEAALVVVGAMLAEAGLSFLGVGLTAPTPSLGMALKEGTRYMLVAPHMVITSGITLMLLVLLFNTLADKLRDTLDK